MPEDHRITRRVEEGDTAKAEEDKVVEHQDKVRQFQWDDIGEEETEGELLVVPEEELQECATLLSEYLLSHIISEHFGELDATGMHFVIPVDLDLHSILQKRFEDKWNLDSRIDMFEGLGLILTSIFDPTPDEMVHQECENEKRIELDKKIQEALPSTHRKKFISGEVSLEHDAMVVDDASDMVSIEISLSFAANL